MTVLFLFSISQIYIHNVIYYHTLFAYAYTIKAYVNIALNELPSFNE